MIREILLYQTPDYRRPFEEWLEGLRDPQIRRRIKARIDRVLAGNFGDTKLVETGVWELRFHFGPGYRVYFGLDGNVLVLLLCGGDKSTQDVDIKRAREYWMDYLRR
ncbi:MAG TPA: type II toxin-antitoxin system RelE/ParE family toxin [Candidatus Omnitrophota bacterium]|nr:type II toxin-antitoxin system RelE/ParE family toxin [Candidatus Omnitrophota bacterium]